MKLYDITNICLVIFVTLSIIAFDGCGQRGSEQEQSHETSQQIENPSRDSGVTRAHDSQQLEREGEYKPVSSSEIGASIDENYPIPSFPYQANSIPIVVSLGDTSFIFDDSIISFEGVQSRYMSPSEIARSQITIRNTGSETVIIDPGQLSFPVVLRYNESDNTWEETDIHRCANAGAGTPRSLISNSEMTVNIPISDAIFERPSGEREMDLFAGGERPVPGYYRLAVRFSLSPWHPLKRPEELYMAFSAPFYYDD